MDPFFLLQPMKWMFRFLQLWSCLHFQRFKKLGSKNNNFDDLNQAYFQIAETVD